MKKAILDKEVSSLSLDKEIIQKLSSHDINIVEDLWVLTRNDLKKMTLTDKEINDIIIKLQLNALDLGGKKY